MLLVYCGWTYYYGIKEGYHWQESWHIIVRFYQVVIFIYYWSYFNCIQWITPNHQNAHIFKCNNPTIITKHLFVITYNVMFIPTWHSHIQYYHTYVINLISMINKIFNLQSNPIAKALFDDCFIPFQHFYNDYGYPSYKLDKFYWFLTNFWRIPDARCVGMAAAWLSHLLSIEYFTGLKSFNTYGTYLIGFFHF